MISTIISQIRKLRSRKLTLPHQVGKFGTRPRSPDCTATPPACVVGFFLLSSLDEEPQLPHGPRLTPTYEA